MNMCLKIKLLLLSIFYLQINCDVYKSVNQDFSKCKVHYSRSESSYTKFYAITDNQRANSSLVFDFHFSVLAPRDAHILLTPSPLIQNLDPVYEIVLGAGGNTYSDIRRLQKFATKSSKKTYNLLSSLDIQSFWLHLSKDGLIEVGREGSELAFLSWKDPDPLPIQMFSFSTWGGVEAKWYYDCKREDGTTSNSQEIEKPLSTTEKLKNDLFTNYDPYIRPTINAEDLIVVHLGFKNDRIQLDETKSVLIFDGIMQMQWLDEKINWIPKEYNDTESLNLHYRQIWQPDLVLYNSASGPGTDFAKSKFFVINSEGWATWVSQVHIEAWCDASGLGHWPQDSHTCEIQLGFWVQDNYLVAESAMNNSLLQTYKSEWEVTSMESGLYLIPTPWNGDSDNYGSTFIMRFTLRRFTSFYTTIYFSPIVVVAISLLSSFWLTPLGPYRISLYCFQLVLLSLFLTKIGLNMPAHPTETPYLVLLYCYGFFATIIALIFTILIINWISAKHIKPLPYYIYRFLSLNYVKLFLYVQWSKFSDSYNKLIDDNTSKNIDIQEMWIILSIALDRILFIIYFITIIIFLSKQY